MAARDRGAVSIAHVLSAPPSATVNGRHKDTGNIRAWLRLSVAGLLAAHLSACSPMMTPPDATPRPRAAPARTSDATAGITPETARSAAARAYYAEIQRSLLARGLLRTDRGGADTPFDDRILTENFIRIALFDEYGRDTGGFVRGEAPAPLRRWQEPVRIALHFGASVPEAQRATDHARIRSYARRLSALTGHPISLVDAGVGAGANFHVHVVSEDEREALAPVLRAELPGLSARDIAGVTRMPRTTYCLVYARSSAANSVFDRAVVVVRAEHPDLLRQACYNEELAQALGLPNDSSQARPSIFNDDEEFALLTRMDELMLRILYDPALRPGMTEDEVRPIVRALARNLLDVTS